jgi:hypothetical protein
MVVMTVVVAMILNPSVTAQSGLCSNIRMTVQSVSPVARSLFDHH